LKLPDGAREAIRRRLGLLSVEACSTLTVAAFVGQEFDAHVLERVAELAAERLSDIVQEALELAVLTQFNSQRYRFAHPLIREALYQYPPAAERIRLHRKIGETLEQLHRTDLKPHLAALAHHFRESGIADKAIDYSIRAGEAAEAVFAYDDALSHLRSALPIAEAHDHHDSQRAGILLRLGRIEVFFENRDQGVEHLEIALKMYEQIGDDQHAGEIHSHLGRLFGAFGPQENVARALVHLQRAELLLGQKGESFALGLVYWGLGYTNIEALRINEALMASQKGMDIFARLGERERWARVAGNHAHCLMVKGKLAPAVALLDEIAGAAAGFVNPDAYLLVIGCCGWFRLLMKDPKEAAHFYRLGLDRSGFQLNIRPFMLEFLTLSELLMGNLAEAKRLAAENRVNDIFRSRIALYEGDWKAAEEKLERALDWAQTADTKWNQLITLGNMVPLLRVAGDYERATAAFERARSLYPPDRHRVEPGDHA
jgi:tetratricopeptide (TPR) repeat protein